MNKIEKLFRKLNQKESKFLEKMIAELVTGRNKFNIVKIKNTDLYRAKKGRFRIIFIYKKDKKIEILAIKLRNEKTYK